MSKRNLRIPESQIEKFKFLINLPNEIKAEFVEVLKSAPIGISESALYDLLRNNVKNLSQKRLGDIYSIYINLSSAKAELELTDSEFLEDLKYAFDEIEDDEININDDSLDVFEKLFNSENHINTSRKIENEYLLNEKNFESIKVITDIRTVFDKNELIGSTIVNKLKITFFENDESKDFFVAVDEHDIENIIKDLQEAQINNSYIKNNLNKLNLVSLVK